MTSLAASHRQAKKQLAAAGTSVSPGFGGRIAATLLLLSLAAASAAGLLLAMDLVDPALLRVDALGDWMGESWINRLSFGAGSGAVGLLALAFLFRGPGATQLAANSRHIVKMGERGVLYVNSESVSALAVAAVRGLPEVMDAEVRVRGAGSAPVRLLIRAVVLPGASLPDVGQAAQDAARDAATRLGGLTVQDVNIELVVSVPDNLDRILE